MINAISIALTTTSLADGKGNDFLEIAVVKNNGEQQLFTLHEPDVTRLQLLANKLPEQFAQAYGEQGLFSDIVNKSQPEIDIHGKNVLEFLAGVEQPFLVCRNWPWIRAMMASYSQGLLFRLIGFKVVDISMIENWLGFLECPAPQDATIVRALPRALRLLELSYAHARHLVESCAYKFPMANCQPCETLEHNALRG